MRQIIEYIISNMTIFTDNKKVYELLYSKINLLIRNNQNIQFY